jgi:AAA family ATP:ADP antiporter
MNLRRRLSHLLMLHRGEGRTVLFLSTVAALAGFGLSIGRASSDALFFTQYGAEHLPQMFALIAVVLIPFSLAYAAFVDRLTPYRMFVHLLLGFGAMVGISWLAMWVAGGHIGIALYFIAYGVISELLLTHFTHYTLSFFDTQQAKRLLPSVMAIFRVGAILGGVFLGLEGSGMATEHAALVWTLCLAVTMGLVAWRHRGEPIHSPIKRGRATTPVQMVREGLMFSRQSRLVRIMALGMFLLVLLLSVQEYLVGSIFAQHYPDEHSLTAFFGWLSAIINTCVLIIQLFLFGRLLRRFGLKTMNLVYPFTTLLSFGLMAINAGYLTAVLGRINTVGVLPGVRNTVYGFFFHALPGYMQGRAHALIGGLVLPLGLLVSALFLWLVPQDASLEWVAGGGFVIAIAMFWVKLKKNAAYADSLVELISQSVFTKDGETVKELGGLDRAAAFRLAGYMRQTDSDSIVLNYADMLESLAPEHAGAAMLEVYPDLSPKLQDQLLSRIARLAPPGWADVAWEAAQRGDPHLAETTARLLLAAGFPAAKAQAETWLESASPRLRSSAAVGYLHGDATELRPRAFETLNELLQSPNPDDHLAALGALATMPHADFLPLIRPMLGDENVKVCAFALDIWSRCPHTGVDDRRQIIDRAQASPSYLVRAAAIRAAARLPLTDMPGLDWLSHALCDADYRVREAGQECAKVFMPKHRAAWVKELAQRRTDFDLQAVMIKELAVSAINDKPGMMKPVSDWHVEHARKKLQIREHLAELGMRDSPELLLLMQVLREEARRHLDVVLHILGCMDQGRNMSCIRAGLASGDKHLWAQAMETAIQHKKEGGLFRELAILYEAERNGADLGGEPPGGKMALATWLEWCQEYGSKWLAECARYCHGSKGFAS